MYGNRHFIEGPKRIPTVNSVIFSPTYVVSNIECSENMRLMEIGAVKPAIVGNVRSGDEQNSREF